MDKQQRFNTRKLVLLALLTAIVVVLQMLGAIIKLGPFSISLVLIPIAVGAALTGAGGGAWLGFVFGIVVLFSGDAALFLAFEHPLNPFLTWLVVLLKGALAGFVAGLLYKVISAKSKAAACFAAAIACPVVNTGLFIIGSLIFFEPYIAAWGEGVGFASAAAAIFIGMVGLNFLVELAINLVLIPGLLVIINYGQDLATEAKGKK
jgi:uncharacterized membrane protein